MKNQPMRIATVSSNQVKSWLSEFKTWGTLPEHIELQFLASIATVLEQWENFKRLDFAFEQLGLGDQYTSRIRSVFEDIRKTLVNLLGSEATRRDAINLVKNFVPISSELEKYFLQLEQKSEDFRTAALMDVIPAVKDDDKDAFAATWKPYLLRLFKELSALQEDLQESEQTLEEKLITAAGRLSSPADAHRRELIQGAARQLASLKKASVYLSETQKLDTRTIQFIQEDLVPSEPYLHDLKDDDELFGAEVLDDLILEAMDKFRDTKKRGKISYTVYSINDTPVLLYDDWVICPDIAILDEIATGKIAMRPATASKISLKKAVNKTAAVLRCTFTSNSNFDDTFLDWLRSINAKKIGPNTWDVPTSSSVDIDRVKAQLDQLGYPFIYENLETPSALVDLYDVDVNSPVALASLVKIQYLPKEAVIREEQKDSKHYMVLRSGEDPSSNWVGIRVEYDPDSKESKERARKKVEQREKQVQFFKRDKKAQFLSEKALQTVTAKLQAVSKHPIVKANHGDTIDRMLRDVPVVAELLVADRLDSFGSGMVLASPTEGSSIQVGGEVYWVTGSAFEDPYGWLTLEDGQNNPFVVTRPDMQNNIGIIPKLEYEKMKDDRSIGDVTSLEIDPSMMAPIPVVVVNDSGSGHGCSFCGDQLPLPALDAMPPWSEGPLYEMTPPTEPGCGCQGMDPQEPCPCGAHDDHSNHMDYHEHELQPQLQEQVLVPVEDPMISYGLDPVPCEDCEGLPMVQGDSPLGGLENNLYLHSPNSSLPPIDYSTGRGVLYYPTPTNFDTDVLNPIEQYRLDPVSVNEELPTEQTCGPQDMLRQVDLYQKDPDGKVPKTRNLGPHPNSPKNGPTPEAEEQRLLQQRQH